jgi:hypothetical protein
MNLQEQISRIKSMMFIENVTGKTIQNISKVINQPAIIVGDKTEKTNVTAADLIHNGTINIKFKNGYKINLSQKDFNEITLKLPLIFKRK